MTDVVAHGEHSSVENHRRMLSDAILDLRTLRDHAVDLKLDETAARADEVLDRAENDFFRIAVVGEFKRGKSTLINALLGREILPADVLPCSATLNRITYGLQPSVSLVFKEGTSRDGEGGAGRTETIGIDALPDYVTKLTPESELRAADIKEAVVHYPVKYCRDKADIIDTPGLNDDQAMTDVTMSVLPNVDAALLVILAQSPFSSYEADFLNRLLSRDMGRVLFVVNRMDSIRRPADRQRILAAVSERIERSVKARAAELHGEGSAEYQAFLARVGKPRVFGLSGALGLEAKLDGDDALLQESGLPAFEAALDRFLTQERGLITLTILNDTVGGSAAKLVQQIRIHEGALQMKEHEFDGAYEVATKRLAELRTRYAAEMAALDSAAARLSLEVGPAVAALPSRLEEVVRATVVGARIGTGDIDKANAQRTAETLTKAINDQVRATARLESEKVQLEIERCMEREVERLGDFAKELSATLSEIEIDFQSLGGQGGAGKRSAGDYVVEGLVAAPTVLLSTLLGGVWGGYREAGFKGAAVGGVAGIATGFGALLGAGMVISALSLPLTWPVTIPAMILVGVSSFFGGKFATRMIFRGAEVEAFKRTVQERAIEQLRASFAGSGLDMQRGLHAHIQEAFGALRQRLDQELGGSIEQTQRTLDDLSANIHRSAAVREHELARLAVITEEVEAVRRRSQALAARVAQIAAT
ncbi:MAG: dynamin family protein [Pseudomonadota bacterium]